MLDCKIELAFRKLVLYLFFFKREANLFEFYPTPRVNIGIFTSQFWICFWYSYSRTYVEFSNIKCIREKLEIVYM